MYKLLYETFSYPEAKELDALLPLPTSYLIAKPPEDQEESQNQNRQLASRQLTYRTVSGSRSEDNGSGKLPGSRQKDDGDSQGSSGSSSGGSSGESEQFEDDDGAEEVSDTKPKSTVTPSSTQSPSSKPHRRLERAVSGSKLPPLPRSWREHGRDFGLPVREDRWLKHVSAKRREAQLIQRGLRDQLRARAQQWRQHEGNRFHQRYMSAGQGAR